MLKVFDVCSGIGGFSQGLESTGGFETVAFCEFDPFCQKVLKKHWPNVPIYNDLKELGNEPERIIQEFDLICGGIPCQLWSVCRLQKSAEDDRHRRACLKLLNTKNLLCHCRKRWWLRQCGTR